MTRRPPPNVGPARPGERGQTLVEFALVFPIFLLCLFGIIDGGRLVFLNSTLSQAAREGARQASVEISWLGSTDPSCGTVGGPICPATVDVLKSHVVAAANRMTAPFAAISAANVFLSCDTTTPPAGSWTTSTCVAHDNGAKVSVRVTTTFAAITPVIGQILGNLSLSGATTMVIN